MNFCLPIGKFIYTEITEMLKFVAAPERKATVKAFANFGASLEQLALVL